jgi:hypothetical protein
MHSDRNTDRITFRHLFQNLLAVVVFEKGLPFTCRELILRPGSTIYDYLFTEKRSRYSKPFYSVIIMTALSTFALVMVGSTASFMEGLLEGGDHVFAGKEEAIGKLLFDYPTILSLIWIPINGCMSYLFFRKSGLYLSEHFVLNTYLLTIQYLIGLFFTLFVPLATETILMLGFLFGFIYQLFLYYSFFNRKMNMQYTLVRTFAAVFFGTFFYTLGMSIILIIWVRIF